MTQSRTEDKKLLKTASSKDKHIMFINMFVLTSYCAEESVPADEVADIMRTEGFGWLKEKVFLVPCADMPFVLSRCVSPPAASRS